jgi:hypothetical protein
VQGRRARELTTIEKMIAIHCADAHPPGCRECPDLRAYAERRLERCPFGDDKPTCLNCPVHCYRSDMRERVRAVMRSSGPRMLRRHPVLALLHLLVDSRRRPPAIGSSRSRPG